jgi:3',5'-nucleoside bisphosphate phosphatase
MPVDLHIHTNFSDGLLSPEEVVKAAKKAGLTTIAITDHDTVDGIIPAQKEAAKLGMTIVPGIEFTTDHEKDEIHILGYFMDFQVPWLQELLTKIRSARVERIYKTVEKLQKLGLDIKTEEVLALADDKGSVGRPHIARALIKKGLVRSIQEAFAKYLDHSGPAYVPHFKLTPFEAIKVILKAKGIPVYAHPGLGDNDDIIPDLVLSGLKGIEVYYSRHTPEQKQKYIDMAHNMNLLITGGSDFHGSIMRDVKIGEGMYPDAEFKKLEEYKKNAT